MAVPAADDRLESGSQRSRVVVHVFGIRVGDFNGSLAVLANGYRIFFSIDIDDGRLSTILKETVGDPSVVFTPAMEIVAEGREVSVLAVEPDRGVVLVRSWSSERDVLAKPKSRPLR